MRLALLLSFSTFKRMMSMMKSILILTMCFAFGFSKSQKAVVEKIRLAMNAQQMAWNAGDIEKFMAYYWHSDSLKFIGSKSITYGWQGTYDNYKKSYPTQAAMGKLTFTLLEITPVAPNYVYVIGKWMLQKEKPVGGHFTLLWKKMKGQWLIIADHTS